jgi:hypothetical protein
MTTMVSDTHARRAVLALAVVACVFAIGATAAQAQATLTWTAPHLSDSLPGTLGITALSCVSTSLCVAVDDAGQDFSTTSPATGGWTAPGQIAAGTPHLTGVSCPSTTLCVATDKHGDAYATATPTTTAWTEETAIDGTTPINAISCPSTALCVAVDNSGDVLTSTAPGSPPWAVQTHVDGLTTPITAVSCSSTSLCVAVTSVGTVLVSTNPTTSSSWVSTTLSSGTALGAVSCNSSATCVAVGSTGSSGTVYATAAVATAPVTWSSTPVDTNALSSVSCTDADVCVLLDHARNALVSDAPSSGQPGWASTPIDPDDVTLTAVDCVDAGFCVAADSLGYTLVGTLPGPTVTTGTGSASSQTTATVNATVNANDATLSDCHFDYGSTTSYGSSVPCTVTPSATGGPQAVTAQIGGLNASTTYHFRIAASSGVATSDGADATFTTAAPLKPSPSISGTPAVGSTLTCKPGVTTSASETTSYQWLSDTNPIAGATSSTYVIAPTDQSHHLSCNVTISGDGGSASATSGFDGVPAQSGGSITESFVGTDQHRATSISAPVTCSPQATGSCKIKLQLTATTTVRHRTQKTGVGSLSTTIGAGAQRTLTVSLNSTGKRLLKKLHTLNVTLTVSGTVIGTLTATLQTDKVTFTQKGARRAAHHAR